jgi:hypothetical protein
MALSLAKEVETREMMQSNSEKMKIVFDLGMGEYPPQLHNSFRICKQPKPIHTGWFGGQNELCGTLQKVVIRVKKKVENFLSGSRPGRKFLCNTTEQFH